MICGVFGHIGHKSPAPTLLSEEGMRPGSEDPTVTSTTRLTLVVNHPKTYRLPERQQSDESMFGIEPQVDAGVALRVIEGGAPRRTASERRRLARWAATWVPSPRVLTRIAHIVARAS
jgi:hypothetical protein